jgi:uncharacterized protein (TIGR00369 family)
MENCDVDELSEFIGIRFVAPDITEVEVGPRHINPAGVVSGAVIYALVDYGMGRAVWEIKEPQERALTVSIAITYVSSATRGRVVCRTRIDQKTGALVLLESEVHHEEGRLLARALGTFAFVSGADRADHAG